MSDSDDTDILLLIPPDFFVAETNLNESFKYDDSIVVHQPIETTPKRQNILVNGKSPRMDRNANKQRQSPSAGGTLKKQSACVGLNKCHVRGGATFKSPPKPSHPSKTVHKTPLKSNDDSYLKEIDTYLAGYSSSGTKLRDINAILASNGVTPISFSNNKHECGGVRPTVTEGSNENNNALVTGNASNMDRNAMNESLARTLDGGRMSDWCTALQQNTQKNDEQLVNLNDIWETDLPATTSDIHEEQLRRRQCERQIQNMQQQITEYQEKILVAIKIDQTKNEALAKLHETNSK